MEKVRCPYCNKEFPLQEGLKSHLNTLENEARQKGENKAIERNKRLSEETKKLSEKNKELLKQSEEKDNLIKNSKTLQDSAVKNAREDEKLKNRTLIEQRDLKLKRAEESNKNLIKLVEKQKKLIDQGGSADQGSAQEIVLLDYLKNVVFKNKKEDKFSAYAKGKKGGDVLHEVFEKGELIGKILYESKNTDSFDSKWPVKLNEDMSNANADIGIFFTKALPRYFDKNEDFYQNNNIFICKYDHTALRTLARINRIMLNQSKKTEKSTKGNQTGIIEFFNNPKNKNIITIMMKSFGGIGDNINKVITYADKARKDHESSDEKFEELFTALSKVGVFFEKK